MDEPIRLARPEDIDPERVPFFSIWVRTRDDPDPLDSPVFAAFDEFVDEVAGIEDAFWTALHWATGEVPTSAAVPAPPGETERVYVWRDRDLFAMTASPAKGIRPQFPPEMPVDRRLEFLAWFTRIARRLRETELADIFREPVTDYRTREAWEDLKADLADSDETLGAVALFWVVEEPG